ncbi:hypothetical protein PRIPAC_72965, partial [Pristionchus pacificus]
PVLLHSIVMRHWEYYQYGIIAVYYDLHYLVLRGLLLPIFVRMYAPIGVSAMGGETRAGNEGSWSNNNFSNGFQLSEFDNLLNASNVSHCQVPLPGDPVIVPPTPVDSKIPLDDARVPALSHELMARLEELSLVRFSDEQAVANLRASVAKATALMDVDVELLSTVPLHRDGYIIAPLGNVPLEKSDRKLDLEQVRAIGESGKGKAPALKRGRRTTQ